MKYGDPNSCPDCEKRETGTLICSRCMLMLNPPKVFPDDDPNIIHGINCDCDDSCLEMVCDKCGYMESSNSIQRCCGQWMRVF